MPISVEEKRIREKQMVSEMITLYCRKKHHTKDGLCEQCAELKAYAHMRSDKCPFMESKTFCANCRVHCYQKEKREQIKEVMRIAGPRMLFHHPVAALRHAFESHKEKRKMKGEPA